MLKKRVIPCLDIKDNRVVKGTNFINISNVGDPLAMALKYEREGADELVLLDISATTENRERSNSLIAEIASRVGIPLIVGGGIRTPDDALVLIDLGVSKISINSAALKTPKLIAEIARRVGSSSVVLAIDTKKINNRWMVFGAGGEQESSLEALEWAKKGEALGAGEILLTSIDNDGKEEGYNLEITGLISGNLSIPVIASGGAGSIEHIKELFAKTKATGALAASLFHYGKLSVSQVKEALKSN